MSRTRLFLSADGKVTSDQMVTLRKSKVDKLIEEVNTLRADKERLDWLEKQRHDERNPNDREDDPPAYCVWSIQAQSFSLRDAVDAARKEQL